MTPTGADPAHSRDETSADAVEIANTEPRRFFRWLLHGARAKLLRPLRELVFRPRTLQLAAAVAVALGAVVVSHAIDVRIRGQDGDVPVGIVAFLLAYPIAGWVGSHTRRRRVAPRLASLWLRIREKNPTLAEGVATIIFTALIGGGLKAAGVQVPGSAGDVVLAGSAFVFAYLFVSQITNLMVGTLVRKVHAIGAAAQGDARATILAFVNRRLGRLDTEIAAVLSEVGIALDVEDVEFWTEECFALGRGRYDGTESHLPSEFVRLYPNYLDAHGKMLESFPQPAYSNHRVLIGPHSEFRDDFIDRYDEGYKEFLDWHGEKKVRLLHIEQEDAELLVDYVSAGHDSSLPTVDFGIWYEQYAMLFREEPGSHGSKVRLWLVFPGHQWYAQCEKLIDVMLHGPKQSGIRKPVAMRLEEAVPEIFQRELCRRWEEFVNPEKRMEKLAPFLEHVLEDDRGGGVLDAAAGIGSDALWLAEHDFNVTLNEIEPVYRDLIKARFDKADVPLRLFGADWRELYNEMGCWFTAVLVLGNSICLLMSPEQQTRAIKGFLDVLYPGGKLVIDERNYEHFTAHDIAEKIEENPVRNFPYRGTVMYCGTKVRGCPKSIEKDDVVFRYYESDERFHDRIMAASRLDDGLRRELDKREIGSLHLYPFRKGELGRLLQGCGFDEITVYRDLNSDKPVAFDDNGAWFDEDADFFTYVARKPLEDGNAEGTAGGDSPETRQNSHEPGKG